MQNVRWKISRPGKNFPYYYYYSDKKPLWDKKPYRAYRMVTELTECLQEKLKSLQTLQNAYRKKVKKSPCKLPVRFKISL